MAAPTFMNPSVIMFRGDVFRNVCVEVNVPSGGMPGPNDPLWLQPVDATGTQTQLWQYGSDSRIYLSSTVSNSSPLCIGLQGAPSEENALVLVKADPSDQTQQWTLQTNGPSPASLITNGEFPSYCMNDGGGQGNPGDSVLIFPFDWNNLTGNIEWSFVIYPLFPGQSGN